MAFWRYFKVGQQLDGSRVLQGLSKADPSLTKAGSRWVMMRQSLLIALITTGQLAFIGKQKVLHRTCHFSWDMMGHG
jgi:hypothetical protein